jgi:hypothetical protein
MLKDELLEMGLEGDVLESVLAKVAQGAGRGMSIREEEVYNIILKGGEEGVEREEICSGLGISKGNLSSLLVYLKKGGKNGGKYNPVGLYIENGRVWLRELWLKGILKKEDIEK